MALSLFVVLRNRGLGLKRRGKPLFAGSDGRIVLQVESAATRTNADYPLTGLLKSLAELFSALNWPLLALFILITFGKQLRNALDTLGSKLQSAETVKLGWLELVLQKSDDLAKANRMARTLTSDQERLAVVAQELASEDSLPVIKREMIALARKYETTRSNMEPGRARTAAMDRIMAQMRS